MAVESAGGFRQGVDDEATNPDNVRGNENPPSGILKQGPAYPLTMVVLVNRESPESAARRAASRMKSVRFVPRARAFPRR
jgi:hypothetical protein